MKYIFRYSILSFFGQNQQITINQLSEALNQIKFSKEKYPINQLLDLSKQCIEKLIRSPEKNSNIIIKESFDVGNFSDLDVTDLHSIWENQKHFIFKEIIKNSTQSANSFDKFGISIRSKIASKIQNKQKGGSVIFTLTSKNSLKQSIVSQFQLNSLQSKQFLTSLKDAQSLLDQILG